MAPRVIGPGPRVVIVGAGASGALTAIHLLREARRRAVGADVCLLDPASSVGRGTAFGTRDDEHLLNVASTGMSALPEEPDHFDAWLARRGSLHDANSVLFALRSDFAEYLGDTVNDALGAAAGLATLRHERSRAVGVRRSRTGAVVLTEGGGRIEADAVVVATGLPPAGDAWAPQALRDLATFVPDPWRPGALEEVRRDASGPADVLVVGSSLTMVDVVLTLARRDARPDRRVHAVSRRGRLPKVHREWPVTRAVPDVSGWGDTLTELRGATARHVREVLAETGDWRPAIDGLRFRFAELWQRLDEPERLEFLRRDASTWNDVRHRMAPSSAGTLGALEATGRLTRSAGEVLDVEPLLQGGARVTTTDGAVREVGWVINCTGPQADIRKLGDPLLDDLLLDDLLDAHDGGALATVATAGMGFRTVAGRLVDSAGNHDAPVWTLGALRRGELGESTAVPEIRAQAQALASTLFDEFTSGSVEAAPGA